METMQWETIEKESEQLEDIEIESDRFVSEQTRVYRLSKQPQEPKQENRSCWSMFSVPCVSKTSSTLRRESRQGDQQQHQQSFTEKYTTIFNFLMGRRGQMLQLRQSSDPQLNPGGEESLEGTFDRTHDILYQIACVFQAQIFDNNNEAAAAAASAAAASASAASASAAEPNLLLNSIDELPNSIQHRISLFDLKPSLPPLDKLHATDLKQENPDESLKALILEGLCPTVNEMYIFLRFISDSVTYSPEANVFALIYIIRMSSHHTSIKMTHKNWRMMWTTYIILAQKVWDEQSKTTAAFTSILPGVTKQQLRDLEYVGLYLLNFNTTITNQLYTIYLEELQCLDPSGSYPNNPKLLSDAQASIIENRTTREPCGKIRSKKSVEVVRLKDVSLKQAEGFRILSKKSRQSASNA
jgi:hypothetical protein